MEPAPWPAADIVFPPLAAFFDSRIATAGQRVGKGQGTACCRLLPLASGSALKSAFLILVGNVAMWHDDLRQFPLLAADFRFDAIRSLLGRATSAAKAEPITKTGPARWIAGGPAGHESGG